MERTLFAVTAGIGKRVSKSVSNLLNTHRLEMRSSEPKDLGEGYPVAFVKCSFSN